MHHHDIAEQNIERLLNAAYQPENVDADFARRLEETMCRQAQDLAAARAAAVPDHVKYRTLRRRLGWAMTAAACVALCALAMYAERRRESSRSSPQLPGDDHALVQSASPGLGMMPRPRPAATPVKPLAVGERIATKVGERRRVTLADGSILFLNENSAITYRDERKLELTSGEVYVEVAQRPAETFEVKTPSRTVAALGTHFAVQAKPAGTGVLVTQGKVQLGNAVVTAGQQVEPGETAIVQAPRASHVLGWTRDLMAAAETPLVPSSKHAGGSLVAVDPNGQEMHLSMRNYHIDVHIEDGFARTTIDQTYFNHSYGRLEGTFYFPLPADASLSRLAMYVEENGMCRLMEGGMAERDHARNVYETIRHTQRDPALLEWVDGTTFKMRVFPLEGRKEKRIILGYTQRLSSLYGFSRYRFPGGHTMEAVRDWSVRAFIKDGARLNISTDPNLQINRDGRDAVLSMQAKNIKPDRDSTLEIRGQESGVRSQGAGVRGQGSDSSTQLSTFTHEGADYLMVRHRPALKSEPKKERRHWVVLFESSSSRNPLLARAQIDLVRYLLLNAEHDDTFSVVTAGTRTKIFDEKPRPATPDNIAAAVKFLEGTHLIGALDLDSALKAVTQLLESSKLETRNPHLVHVGGGLATIGETRDEVLTGRLPEGTRYVGIGVGKRWNRTFMKLAAERTAGYYRQVTPDESLAWHGFDLVATLNTPRLMQIKVVDNAERATFLTEASMISQGEEICAIARIERGKASPEAVTVTGRLDGKPFTRVLKVSNVANKAGYLPRAWAKLEIDRLIAEGADKHKPRIVELSKASYVMSPFTSLLVLETDADYERFKVDRGRKDHWAMYSCPERIAIVHEPGTDVAVKQPTIRAITKRPPIRIFLESVWSSLNSVPDSFIGVEINPLVTTDIDPSAQQPNQDINFNVERKAEVSVPGHVNPLEQVGIMDGDKNMPPVNLPAPGGLGGIGQGGALESTFGQGMAGGYGLKGMPLAGTFYGRSGATRKQVLIDGGGTNASEAAVVRGLQWLKRTQQSDGSWQDADTRTGHVAGTALGLLPFLAAGKTHKISREDDDFTRPVEKGLLFLIRKQNRKQGDFGHDMEAHGLATLVLAEAFGLTQDPALRRPAQMAINYIVRTQQSTGGWGRAPGKPGDLLISGWQIMALRAAQMAGLDVAQVALRNAESFLDACCDASTESYRQPGARPTPAMNAIGLLCRQILQNWGPWHDRMARAIDKHIKPLLPTSPKDFRFLLFATEVMHHGGGKDWEEWNRTVRDALVDSQDVAGPPNGSWSPRGNLGRLAATSFALLTLEVYYRHLPLFQFRIRDCARAELLLSRSKTSRDSEDKVVFALAGIDYLFRSNQVVRAENLLHSLVEQPELAKEAGAWRIAAKLAEKRGLLGQAVEYQEKAINLEYSDPPAIIALQKLRSDFAQLLTLYHQQALALGTDAASAKSFAAKVVRAADHWRALDNDPTQACQLAAKILQVLGFRELAWDYLTTPIDQRPNEAAPWLELAQLTRDSDFELTDRAFGLAFRAEATNAQILWDHARFLQASGRDERAQRLYRQIADGDWQPRFQNLKSQARGQLLP